MMEMSLLRYSNSKCEIELLSKKALNKALNSLYNVKGKYNWTPRNHELSLSIRPSIFNRLVEHLRLITEQFPDIRVGDNTQYSMADAAMGAFSVFFMQSPSFLDAQRSLQISKGCNNAHTLFGLMQIPCDNQIRNLLAPVPPSELFPVFSSITDGLNEAGHLDNYRSINSDLL